MMKRLLQLFLLFVSVSCAAQPTGNSDNREIVFRSVNVLPMETNTVLRNRDVLIKDGKIAAIGEGGKLKYGSNAHVINASGFYLMPGLAEMHAHVPPNDNVEAQKEVAKLFGLYGITTIRGMLGHPTHLALRQMLQSGELWGPRFTTSGPSFNGQSVKSADAAATLVRQQKEAGYDFLKLHPGLTVETFNAMANTAKEVGIPFAGHVSYDVGVWRAIEAGYATIDHLDGFVESLVPKEVQSEQTNGLFGMFIGDKADTTKIPALITALKQNNIWVVPTQALAERWMSPVRTAEAMRAEPEMKYMPASTLNNWVTSKNNMAKNPAYNADAVNRFIDLRRKLIRECNKNGVGLLLGCDAPQVFNVPGISTHHELQYLVDAGLSPYDALRTGTVNVGRFFNRPDMGVVKAGAVADLVLLKANPLENIANTKLIAGVMIGGRYLPETEIASELKKLEKQ
ncbi:MAG TPA: amidohydrolase family protein [Flavisolibacter sp.]|jgi:imidazolonepropionase-like amidohydrolase|nr:amidohydrolase family protein [Flavisolibacter sp.]